MILKEEKTLLYHQARANLHRKRLYQMLDMRYVWAVLLLVPPFLWGWVEGKKVRMGTFMQSIANFGMMRVAAYCKDKFLLSLL